MESLNSSFSVMPLVKKKIKNDLKQYLSYKVSKYIGLY